MIIDQMWVHTGVFTQHNWHYFHRMCVKNPYIRTFVHSPYDWHFRWKKRIIIYPQVESYTYIYKNWRVSLNECRCASRKSFLSIMHNEKTNCVRVCLISESSYPSLPILNFRFTDFHYFSSFCLCITTLIAAFFIKINRLFSKKRVP